MKNYIFDVYEKESENLLTSFAYYGGNAMEAFEEAAENGVFVNNGKTCCVVTSTMTGLKIKFEIGN